MPVLLVPALAGLFGFGVGFFSGNALNSAVKVAALGGAGYLAYQYMNKG